MKIFYPMKQLSWEHDYCRYDIFNSGEEFINYTDKSIDTTASITDTPNILFVNHFMPLTRALEMIDLTHPIAIFHFSDEHGNLPIFHTTLPKYTKAVFRQHNNKNYNYEKNSFQIPLGYITDYLSGKSSIDIETSDITSRENNSAFIGQIKTDREYMCRVFQENMPNTSIYTGTTTWNNPNGLKVKPCDMFHIYSKTKFVLVGRGNSSLDCFRFYEALIAGAIPVVVGSEEEIRTSYNFDGHHPKMVSAQSWDDALVKCKNLLKEPEKMEEIQRYNKLWWKTQIMAIKEKISFLVK